MNEADSEANNQLAFDVAERELGIQPVTTGKELAAEPVPDKLIMVLYLSKFYEKFYSASMAATGMTLDLNPEPLSLYLSVLSLTHSLPHPSP